MNDDKSQKHNRESNTAAEPGADRVRSRPVHERQTTVVGGIHGDAQAYLQKLAKLLGRQAAQEAAVLVGPDIRIDQSDDRLKSTSVNHAAAPKRQTK